MQVWEPRERGDERRSKQTTVRTIFMLRSVSPHLSSPLLFRTLGPSVPRKQAVLSILVTTPPTRLRPEAAVKQPWCWTDPSRQSTERLAKQILRCLSAPPSNPTEARITPNLVLTRPTRYFRHFRVGRGNPPTSGPVLKLLSSTVSRLGRRLLPTPFRSIALALVGTPWPRSMSREENRRFNAICINQ